MLINVKVDGSAARVLKQPPVAESVRISEGRLGGRGRVLLRASGTEPLIRVMVEADQQSAAQSEAEFIASRVQAAAAPSTH